MRLIILFWAPYCYVVSPYGVNRCSVLRSVFFKRHFDYISIAVTLLPHIGWWALKSLSKIISFFILSKANFINLSIIMTFLLPIRLYMLITITLTLSRRIVTTATYALYGLYAQSPGANNLLIIKYILVILSTLYRSKYPLG